MNYRPLGSRCLIDPIEITQEDRMVGSIELAESAIVLQRGKVLAVGRGDYAMNGELIPMEVKVGDTVIFRREAGYLPIRLPNDDRELHLMLERDLEAIV